jgi:exodeoxyribonuclease VII large subunit
LVAAREDELTTQVESLTRDLLLATRYRMMDMRAHLQGLAMSRVFEDVRERVRAVKESVGLAGRRLEHQIVGSMQAVRRLTDSLTSRLSPLHLGALVSAGRNKFDLLCATRDAAGIARLEDASARLRLLAGSLDALSPLAVLQRGYALAQDKNGKLIRDAATMKIGDRLGLRVAQGALKCRVEEIDNT